MISVHMSYTYFLYYILCLMKALENTLWLSAKHQRTFPKNKRNRQLQKYSSINWYYFYYTQYVIYLDVVNKHA